MPDEQRRPCRSPAPSALAAGRLLGVPFGVLLGVPASAGAQGAPPDSLPARAGTYALEGGVGINSSSLGVLRFFSPRSALGLSLTGGASHSAGSTSTSTTSSSSGSIGLTLGYRRYARPRDRVAVYGTAGLTTSYTRGRQSQTNTTAQGTFVYLSRDTYGSVGAFGELGATYLVLRRLTLNASAVGSVGRTFTRSATEQSGPSGAYGNVSRLNGVGASLGPVRLGLTLFL